MGSHCFILGAGFSRAYSNYAPLMSDFLKLARDRGFYEPEGRHKTLAELASTYFGSPLNVNIESLASSLAVKTGTFLSLEPRAEVAYADLVSVIETTLKHIYEYPIDSSTKHLFSKFAHALVRIQDDAAIITLNYDLLMDQLLRDTDEWFPIDGYGFNFPVAAFSTATNERLLAEAKARKGKPVEEPLSAIRLLKMHGSLNWALGIFHTLTGPYR